MSAQITTAMVKQYSANVFHLSQQKGSRLAMAVRNESQRGEEQFWERIGSVTAIKKTSRHMDTPQLDTPHSRRRVTLEDYIYADLIDSADRIRTLIDPTSPYAQAAMWAMGRAKDDEIIAAANGNAYAGKEGGTTVALPTAQRIHAVSGGALSGMNVAALRRAKQILDAADVDPSIPRYCAISSTDLFNLLGETEVTSSDYNSVKALVMGEVDTFLGFNFIRTERLTSQSDGQTFNVTTGLAGAGSNGDGSTQCFAWAQDGLLLATGMEVRGRVDERSDKNYSTQVYAEMGVGATRMEEAKVVQINAV